MTHIEKDFFFYFLSNNSRKHFWSWNTHTHTQTKEKIKVFFTISREICGNNERQQCMASLSFEQSYKFVSRV